MFLSYISNSEEVKRKEHELYYKWKNTQIGLVDTGETVIELSDEKYLSQILYKVIPVSFIDDETKNLFYITLDYQGKNYKDYMDARLEGLTKIVNEIVTSE